MWIVTTHGGGDLAPLATPPGCERRQDEEAGETDDDPLQGRESCGEVALVARDSDHDDCRQVDQLVRVQKGRTIRRPEAAQAESRGEYDGDPEHKPDTPDHAAFHALASEGSMCTRQRSGARTLRPRASPRRSSILPAVSEAARADRCCTGAVSLP